MRLTQGVVNGAVWLNGVVAEATELAAHALCPVSGRRRHLFVRNAFEDGGASLEHLSAQGRSDRDLLGVAQGDMVEKAAVNREAPGFFEHQGVGGKLQAEVGSRWLARELVVHDNRFGNGITANGEVYTCDKTQGVGAEQDVEIALTVGETVGA